LDWCFKFANHWKHRFSFGTCLNTPVWTTDLSQTGPMLVKSGCDVHMTSNNTKYCTNNTEYVSDHTYMSKIVYICIRHQIKIIAWHGTHSWRNMSCSRYLAQGSIWVTLTKLELYLFVSKYLMLIFVSNNHFRIKIVQWVIKTCHIYMNR
jgi:hypothetical protein